MGTRSRIAITNSDGTFDSIYVHWDGNPGHHGPILRDHYGTEELARSLIALGDLSSLGEKVGSKHEFGEGPDGECDAYGRDRGEDSVGPARSDHFQELCEVTQGCGGEYLYVFKGGNWFCAKGGMSAFGNPASKAPEFLEHIDEVLRQEAQESQG